MMMDSPGNSELEGLPNQGKRDLDAEENFTSYQVVNTPLAIFFVRTEFCRLQLSKVHFITLLPFQVMVQSALPTAQTSALLTRRKMSHIADKCTAK